MHEICVVGVQTAKISIFKHFDVNLAVAFPINLTVERALAPRIGLSSQCHIVHVFLFDGRRQFGMVLLHVK